MNGNLNRLVPASAIAIAILLCQGCWATSWSYQGRNGLPAWELDFPHCSGTHQSPVAIENREALYEDFGQIVFSNYQKQQGPFVISNTARTVQVTHESDSKAFISGSGFGDYYKFSHANFHWGSSHDKGSEHTIDKKQYPLELQLVHFKNKYRSLEEAVNHYDGIAVLSILFKSSYFDNRQLEPIVRNLRSIRQPYSEKHVNEKFRLVDILPLDTATFYRYGGSLTTPPCTEGVIWTIFDEKLPISERQLNEFRTLLDEMYDTTYNNFRSVQSVNGRSIYRSGRASSYKYCFIPYICPYIEDILQQVFLNIRSAYSYADESATSSAEDNSI